VFSIAGAGIRGICKPALSLERCVVFEQVRPPFWGRRPFHLAQHRVLCTPVFFPNLFRAFKKRPGALFRSFVSRGPLLRPRRKTQHYVVIGVRSGVLFGQNGPGTREGCTFSKGLFLIVFRESTLYVVFCVPLGAPGPHRALSGEAPGAQEPDQGHGHCEASFRSCLAVAGGQPREPQTANHDVQVCRKPSSRQVCVQNPRKIRGFGAIVAPPGSKTRGK
jgi:hypothetical protein